MYTSHVYPTPESLAENTRGDFRHGIWKKTKGNDASVIVVRNRPHRDRRLTPSLLLWVRDTRE